MAEIDQKIREWINDTINLVNSFPLEINDRPDKIPKEIAEILPHPEIILQVFADISFKLYIINHTKDEKDLEKLIDFHQTLMSLMGLYGPEHPHHVGIAVYILKMAFPLVGDDTIFKELRNFFWELREEHSVDVGVLFIYSLRVSNFCGEGVIAAKQFFNTLPAHEKTPIEKGKSWEYIGPVFNACAEQIKPDYTPYQIGELFSQHFYTKDGGELEQLLKDHGDWPEPKKKGNRNEWPAEVATRARKNYFQDFNDWRKRKEKVYRDLREKLIDYLEKSFWKKKTTVQLLSPALLNIIKTNDSLCEENITEIQDFAKKLKLE